MADVKRCPVCNGRGIVRSDFYTLPVTYSSVPTTTAVSDTPVTCRACGGKGIIIIHDSSPVRTIEPIWINKPYIGDPNPSDKIDLENSVSDDTVYNLDGTVVGDSPYIAYLKFHS